MIPLNPQSLLKYLKEIKIDVKFQEETDQVYLTYHLFNQDFPLFLRVIEGGELLQMILFMPCTAKKETNPDVARLLHLINKELDVPGFGMDETKGLIFYRILLHAIQKKIDTTILQAFLKSYELLSETFFPVILAVVEGKSSFEEVLQKSQEYPT